MPKLTLCCFPGACSRATMIALEEAGATYDTRVPNLMKGEHKQPDYLAINPKGKVPVLIADGVALSENVAILGYLAETYPGAKLLPGDAMQRAQALSAVSWLSSAVLTAISRVFRPERVSDAPGSGERIKEVAKDEIRANLALAERHLAGRTWWVDGWSVADAYLYYIWATAMRIGIDPSAYPSVAAHAARMEERPSTQRVLDWEKRTMPSLQAA